MKTTLTTLDNGAWQSDDGEDAEDVDDAEGREEEVEAAPVVGRGSQSRKKGDALGAAGHGCDCLVTEAIVFHLLALSSSGRLKYQTSENRSTCLFTRAGNAIFARKGTTREIRLRPIDVYTPPRVRNFVEKRRANIFISF